MYLLEYNEQMELIKITPNAPFGLIGAYLKGELPMSIADMLEQGTIEKVVENENIYYKIIKGEQ